MPKVSIVITLQEGQGRPDQLAQSLAEQASGDFELVCVHDGSEQMSAAASEFSGAVVIECREGLPRMRRCGFEAVSGDCTCFLDGSMRVAKGFAQILGNAFAQKPVPQVVTFHMQTIDSDLKEFTSVRRSSRRSGGPIAVVAATELADTLFQECGLGLGNKAFATGYLKASDVWFDALTPYDDELAVAQLLMKAQAMVAAPWALSVRTWSRASHVESLSDQQLDHRLQQALELSESLSEQGSPFARTCAEWVVDLAVDDIDFASDQRRMQLLQSASQLVSPMLQRAQSDGMRVGDWKKTSLLRLAALDREQLLHACIEQEGIAREREYDVAYAQMMVGSQPATASDKPKKRGLFRRG